MNDHLSEDAHAVLRAVLEVLADLAQRKAKAFPAIDFPVFAFRADAYP